MLQLQTRDESSIETGPAPPRYGLGRTIVLVGLMGSGKSSVGKRLAAALGALFVDSDSEIEKAANLSVAEIFERFGEPYFRAGENRVLERILLGDPVVLATGGGAFVAESNRQLVRQHAVSVWLRADVDTLFERVRNKPGRPLLQGDNPKAVLERLANERYAYYSQADVTVQSTPGIAQELVASRIIAAILELEAARPKARPTLWERRA